MEEWNGRSLKYHRYYFHRLVDHSPKSIRGLLEKVDDLLELYSVLLGLDDRKKYEDFRNIVLTKADQHCVKLLKLRYGKS